MTETPTTVELTRDEIVARRRVRTMVQVPGMVPSNLTPGRLTLMEPPAIVCIVAAISQLSRRLKPPG